MDGQQVTKGTSKRELLFYWYRSQGVVPCPETMTSEAPSKTRRHQRISLPHGMTVAWYGGGFQQVSRVQTLNGGGLSVSGDITRPVGSSLMLVFEVPGGVVQAEAVVRNVVPGKEMGLEFTSMGAHARALLDDLLRRLLS